jgi:cytochrome P450
MAITGGRPCGGLHDRKPIAVGGVDLADPRSYSERMPFEAFRKLRERAPVVWHPYKDGPGFLALTGYDEVLAVSRDSATWSSEVSGVHFDVPGPDDLADIRGLMMITMDPPRHTALRALINRGFTPRQVAKLNERIAEMARDLVDRVIEEGQCDFVNDIAGALPSYVIAELLGIPLEDGYRLYELTEITNSGVAGDSNPRAVEAGAQMFAYAGELAARKRAQPGDDIATPWCMPKSMDSNSPTWSSSCSSCCCWLRAVTPPAIWSLAACVP